MTISWILVANASQARLYKVPKAKLFNGHVTLTLIKEFGHPASRKKGIELNSDKLGHYAANSAGHGSMVEASDPKDYEAERFAKQLVAVLDAGRVAHDYEDLILIAPPQFHGKLNKHLNGQISNLVSVVVDKDYTKDNERQLLDHLQGYL